MINELEFLTEEILLTCGYKSYSYFRERIFPPLLLIYTINNVELNFWGEDDIRKEIFEIKKYIRKLKLKKLNE